MSALLRFLLSAILVSAPLLSAHAQGGDQHVRIVLPYPAGGTGDAVARFLSDSLRPMLHRPVIVENKPGAAGRLGVQTVKDAPGDGTVLLLTPIAPMAVFQHLYDKLGYDPVADFAPVAQLATFDLGVAVGPQVPAKSIEELVAWLHAHPEHATYGTPAAGSIPHFFGVLFGQTAKVELRHVAYKGNAQAVTDLMGGHLPIFFSSTPDLVEPQKSGRIRVLATSGRTRSASLPDVPTFLEAGYQIRGEGWYGIYAPARTPVEVLDRLNRAIVAVVRSEQGLRRFEALHLRPTGTSGLRLAEIQQADSAYWRALVKASGFKPD